MPEAIGHHHITSRSQSPPLHCHIVEPSLALKQAKSLEQSRFTLTLLDYKLLHKQNSTVKCQLTDSSNTPEITISFWIVGNYKSQKSEIIFRVQRYLTDFGNIKQYPQKKQQKFVLQTSPHPHMHPAVSGLTINITSP